MRLSLRPLPSFLCAWGALAVAGSITGSEPCLTIAGILFIFAVLPLLVVTAIDRASGPGRAEGPMAILFRVPTFAFGLTAIAIGGSLSAWVLYNAFIERVDEYTGPPVFLGLGLGPMLAAYGVSLVADSLSPGRGASVGEWEEIDDSAWDDHLEGDGRSSSS